MQNRHTVTTVHSCTSKQDLVTILIKLRASTTQQENKHDLYSYLFNQPSHSPSDATSTRHFRPAKMTSPLMREKYQLGNFIKKNRYFYLNCFFLVFMQCATPSPRTVINSVLCFYFQKRWLLSAMHDFCDNHICIWLFFYIII